MLASARPAVLTWLHRQVLYLRERSGYSLILSELDQEKLAAGVLSAKSLERCLRFLIPSFLQHNPHAHTKRPHPSAWLDGLRGVAAFLVVWHHASLLWFPWHIHNGFGSSEEDRLFIQWPFIRILIHGLPMVMIFFVISGYAISYKPLDLARKGRWADFNSALASSVFRRHSRLFIPAATVSFFTALATYLGWFGTEGWGDVAVASRQPPRPGAFLPQLYDWAAHTIEMVDPFSRNDNRGMSNFYDPNLWTLPIEFDFSMVVFLCLAAFSRLRPLVRLIMTFGLLCYANYYTHWRVFLFISGMFLCDLKFYLAENEPTSSLPEHTGDITEDQTPTHTKNTTLIKAAWTVSFILTIYLLSMPEIGRGGRDSPGYKTLAAMIPSQYAGSPDHFWIPLGSAWLVFTIDRASHLQAIFTHRFPQYLGRISYSLYLVHGPLLWTLGRAAAVSAVGLTGRSTNELYCFGIFLSACVFWPVTIWVADIVMRAVDLKAVAFGHWAYASLLRDTNEGN